MASPSIPDFRLEAGLSGALVDPAVWQIGSPTSGQVGVAAIGADNIWVDITYAVRNWSLQTGMTRVSNPGPIRYDAGTLTAELNNGDGAFDPTNLSGPFVVAGESQLTPMVRIRASAIWAGVRYPLWYGFADRWVPDDIQNTWSVTTLTATDAFKVLNSDRAAVTPVGVGEAAGARVSRVLNSLNWPTDLRSISTGDSTLQATDLSGAGLAELQSVTDSEQGEFFMDPSGMATFRNRHAILAGRSAVSQATFGDGGGTEIPYAAAPVDTNDDTMTNQVTATRIGGTAQTATDATSITRYLAKTYSPPGDLLLQTDSDVLQWVQAVLYQNSTPELRFQSIAFNVARPDIADTVWPILLGSKLADRVTVIRRPPGGGDPNQRDVFIRGIGMSGDGADWKVGYTLQAADRYSFFTIGDPILGRIGLNSIAF
jgi:hypothetical protein